MSWCTIKVTMPSHLPYFLNESENNCHNKIYISYHFYPKYFMNFYYLQKEVYTSWNGSEMFCNLVPAYLSSLFYDILPCRLHWTLARALVYPIIYAYQSETLFALLSLPTCYSVFKAWLAGHLQVKLFPQMPKLNSAVLCVPQVCI